jgi:predicted O-methyltransferase YrrM
LVLGIAQRRYDLVYVDGSHHSADVYTDATLAWPLLNDEGILIFDDYEWTLMPEENSRPKLGIDAFLSAHVGQSRGSRQS